jgi:ABC-type ATPase involved in cell division
MQTCPNALSLLCDMAKSGTAVLMATHDGGAVASADRMMLMEDGRLTASTPAEKPSVED